jgi:hypothetical protein
LCALRATITLDTFCRFPYAVAVYGRSGR